MNNESTQSLPAGTSAGRKPVLMLSAGRSNGGKSAAADAVIARAMHTQALIGTNGHMAVVRFRVSPTRPATSHP